MDPPYCHHTKGLLRRCLAREGCRDLCLARPSLLKGHEQGLRGDVIGGIAAFGEPLADRCDQLPSLRSFPLLRPEATEAHCDTQLEGLRLAISRIPKRVEEAGLRVRPA